MADTPELHRLCEPLAPLLGTWRGAGDGGYPTIDDFSYNEELVFTHVGKPFLAMMQRTHDSVTSQPLHAETGYLRALEDGAVELVLAQPSGVVEVDVGSVEVVGDRLVIDLRSVQVALTPTAKPVTAVRRRLAVSGPTLTSELWMAASGETALTHHLTAHLTKEMHTNGE